MLTLFKAFTNKPLEKTSTSIEAAKAKESGKSIVANKFASDASTKPDKKTDVKEAPVKKEEPVKKYKWASSVDEQNIEEKLHFKDSLDPVHIDAINTWSKIVSNAMLYNFATKIAIEESNNYTMDIDGN